MCLQVKEAAAKGPDSKPTARRGKGGGRGRGRGKAQSKPATAAASSEAPAGKEPEVETEALHNKRQGDPASNVQPAKKAKPEGDTLAEGNKPVPTEVAESEKPGSTEVETAAGPEPKSKARARKPPPTEAELQTAWAAQDRGWFSLSFCYGVFLSIARKLAHVCLPLSIKEKDFKEFGIPIAPDFTGTKKSYTLSPEDPSTQSQIGVLLGS